jgi:hypothetical protein
MRYAVACLVLLAIAIGTAVAGLAVDSRAFWGSLFGVAASVALLLIAESLMRPHLSIGVEEEHIDLADGRRFLRLVVTNSAMPSPIDIFVDRRPALFTRAWISFFHEDNAPMFGRRRMRGRWAGTPEPRSAPIRDPNKPASAPAIGVIWDPSGTEDTVDIGPGDAAILDLIMRPGAGHPNDECMGWHNDVIGRPVEAGDESMFSFPQGRYRALVRILSGGRTTWGYFTIANIGPTSHAHLIRVPGAIPRSVIRHALATP